MKRRDVLKWAGALSVGGLVSTVRAEHVGAAANPDDPQEQPAVSRPRGDRKLNILLIVTD